MEGGVGGSHTPWAKGPANWFMSCMSGGDGLSFGAYHVCVCVEEEVEEVQEEKG